LPHLLHLDASINGERSVSRQLSARAAANWRAAHPAGTVTYRDLAADPIPHLPALQQTAAQEASRALSGELVGEILRADTVLLGLPVYNFGPPSTVKAWVDHLVVPGLSISDDGRGLLGDTELIVLESRGGGYAPGTPRHGWDHAEAWLPHGLSLTGLHPRFIIAELTMADTNPAMAHLRESARESLEHAHREIDLLWSSPVSPALAATSR
jgi:FMN-dependent NADH-azoreductase